MRRASPDVPLRVPPGRGPRPLALLVALGVLAALAALGVVGTLTAAPAAAAAAGASPSPSPSGPAGGAKTAPGQETLQGRLLNGPQRTPVEGAKITAEGPNGFRGEATTDAQGAWVIPLPGPGSYRVTIDTGSLPDGVKLQDEKFKSRTVPVVVNQKKPVLFPLGKSTRTTTGTASRAAQLTAEGIRYGLLIALAAIGLSLIFGTTGLTNFAHGELVTFGALMAYLFNNTFGLPFVIAAALAVVMGGIGGLANDVGLWAPLRRRGTGLIAMMIVSIGLGLFLRYLYLTLIGGSTEAFRSYRGQTGVGFGPISLAPKDWISIVIALVVLFGVAFALLRTRLGKATRAVADNPALAAASGINVELVIRTVWIIGGALAALSGVLLGLAIQVNWQMGFQILLLVFAAVTLGGLGTAFGALAGSLVVGLFFQLSTLVIPVELQYVGALVILILVLLVRPQGILGRAQRIG